MLAKSEDLFACMNEPRVTLPVLVVYLNMADSADEVVAAFCSLVLAAGLGAAIILNKSRKQKR